MLHQVWVVHPFVAPQVVDDSAYKFELVDLSNPGLNHDVGLDRPRERVRTVQKEGIRPPTDGIQERVFNVTLPAPRP
jgi:hypothetical protein